MLLTLLPILLFSMCKGKGSSYASEDVIVNLVPAADIYPGQNPAIQTLNISPSEDTGFMDKELAGIRAVALETTDSCLVGTITDLFLMGDTIIVVDGQKAKRIMLFNRQGKYIGHIGRQGSGPGEYASISKARPDSSGIEIYDMQTNRFIRYDYNGNVRQTVTFNTAAPVNVYHVKDDEFLATYASYFKDYPFALRWLNNDSVVASAFPYTIKRNEVAPSIFALDNKTGFHMPVSDTIYTISGNHIIPEYALDLIKEQEAQEYMMKSAMMNPAEEMDFLWHDERAPACFVEFIPTQDHFVVTFQKQESTYISVIDKKTLKSRNYLRGTIKPIRLYAPPFIKSASGNTLICYIDEGYLSQLHEKTRNFIESHFSAEDQQLIKNHDFTTENPIVILMDLK